MTLPLNENYAKRLLHHQTVLFNNLDSKDHRVITGETGEEAELFKELETARLGAWNHPTVYLITRIPDNSFEHSHQRGKQHVNLHNAATSFLTTSRDSYLEHLKSQTSINNLSEKDISKIVSLFAPSKLIKTDTANGIIRKQVVFFFASQEHTHHVEIDIHVQAGIGKNYSGSLNVIAYEMPLANIKPGSIEQTNEFVRSLLLYNWVPYIFAKSVEDCDNESEPEEQEHFEKATTEEVEAYRDSLKDCKYTILTENARKYLESIQGWTSIG